MPGTGTGSCPKGQVRGPEPVAVPRDGHRFRSPRSHKAPDDCGDEPLWVGFQLRGQGQGVDATVRRGLRRRRSGHRAARRTRPQAAPRRRRFGRLRTALETLHPESFFLGRPSMRPSMWAQAQGREAVSRMQSSCPKKTGAGCSGRRDSRTTAARLAQVRKRERPIHFVALTANTLMILLRKTGMRKEPARQRTRDHCGRGDAEIQPWRTSANPSQDHPAVPTAVHFFASARGAIAVGQMIGFCIGPIE